MKTYKKNSGEIAKAQQINVGVYKLELSSGVFQIGHKGDWLVEESPTERYIMKDEVFRTIFTPEKQQLLFD